VLHAPSDIRPGSPDWRGSWPPRATALQRLRAPSEGRATRKGIPPFLRRRSRRSLLSAVGVAAMGAAASMVERALPALGQTAPSKKTSLIDVHHHFAPPAYVAENRSKVSPAALDWTPQKALDAMDAEGVATAVLGLRGALRDRQAWRLRFGSWVRSRMRPAPSFYGRLSSSLRWGELQ
jgi:hypothetical protein